MKTNRFFTAILALVLCVNFVSCGGDDDITDPDGNPTGKVTKRLVELKFEEIHEGGSGVTRISYDGDKVSKISEAYASYEGYYKSLWEYNFNYTTDGVIGTCTHSNTYPEHWTDTIYYTLNDKGYIVQEQVKNEDCITEYSYYGDYLSSISYKWSSDAYQYNSNNLRSMGSQTYQYDSNNLRISGNHFEEMTYTDIPNLGGLFLDYDYDGLAEYFDNYLLAYARLLGKAPKYLPKQGKYKSTFSPGQTYEYELDEDGYVTKVEVKDIAGYETFWYATFTYEIVK